MKKKLVKKNKGTNSKAQVYCKGCAGCGSVPANDYMNIYKLH